MEDRTVPSVTSNGQQEVTPSDGAINDEFGQSVALVGNTAVVGAPNHQVGSNPAQGAAYVYTLSGTSYTLQQELTSADGAANDRFGVSVAISGNMLVIGAPGHNGRGAVYTFTLQSNTWTQQVKEVMPSDGSAGDRFGSSLAISGGTLFVGAPNHIVGSTGNSGIAYVFALSSGKWQQQQELTAPDIIYQGFGISLSISGSTVAIGTEYLGYYNSFGATYVFILSGATWILQQELTAGDGQNFDYFGMSVALSGNTLVVGAPEHRVGTNADEGVAYVFTRSGTSWNQQGPDLVPNLGQASEQFGISVSISGNAVAIGANQYSFNKVNEGASYLFALHGSTWVQRDILTPQDETYNDDFGIDVALSGNVLVVGSAGQGTGAAYFQDLTPAIETFAAAMFPGQGVWRHSDNTGWQQLSPADASSVVADDHGDITAVFSNGLWLYEDATGWQQLTAAKPSQLDIAGTGVVAADFPGNGLWRFGPMAGGAGWQQLTGADALSIAVDDHGDVVAAFQGNGTFLYLDASGWQQLSPAVATQVSIAASGSSLAAAFQGNGVWRYNLQATIMVPVGWQQLTPALAVSLAMGSYGSVVCQFSNGIWLYQDLGGWVNVTPAIASQVGITSTAEILAEFPGNGVWDYTGGTWLQLSPADATWLRGGGG